MSALNRVWDTQAGPGFVNWRTKFPDSAGLFYPGPGTFGVHTSDYCIAETREEQSIQVPGQHGLSAPIGTVQGLWHLDGDLLDSTVNGIDLTMSGTERYLAAGAAGAGARSLYAVNGAYAISAAGAVNDPIRLTGAMTIEFLIYMPQWPPSPSGHVVGIGQTSASTTLNFLYLVAVDTSGVLGYASEDAGGTLHGFNTTTYLALGRWYHIAFTRSTANNIRVYVNGRHIHTQVSHPAVGGGSDSRLVIGDDVAVARDFRGGVASVRIIDDELRPEHVLADARATLPPDLRP